MNYSRLFVSRLMNVCFFCMLFDLSNAQWSTNPEVNNIVTAKSNRENSCQSVTDGSGGAIVVWWDNDELSGDHDIYAQKINAEGIVQWTAGGIGICTNSSHQQNPEVAPDGSGGALITWFDQRNVKNEIFLQRVKSDGTVMWTSDGVSVGTVANHYQHSRPAITDDGSGGAIVTWEDWRGTFESPIRAIYAQRISASGSTLWGVGGKPVTTLSGTSPEIISDGSGGAIVAWDLYVSTGDQRDIYIQKITSDGNTQWTTDGLLLCSNTSVQKYPQLTSDGSGGAIVAWQDNRNGSYSNLYGQWINAAGAIQWASNGVRITPSTSSQTDHKLISDGSGGAFIIWQNSSPLIIAQRINSSGVSQWETDGVAIGSGQDAQMTKDGSTGIIVTWSKSGDIMAQHLNQAGAVQWGVFGVDVCKASAYQMAPQIVVDGSGGAVIVWDDDRNSLLTLTDIYAQRVTAGGTLGLVTGIEENDTPITMGFTLGENYPNPFSGASKISFSVTSPGMVSIKVFNSEGKEVRTLVNEKMNPGKYTINFEADGLPFGSYYCRMKMGAGSQTSKLILLK